MCPHLSSLPSPVEESEHEELEGNPPEGQRELEKVTEVCDTVSQPWLHIIVTWGALKKPSTEPAPQIK